MKRNVKALLEGKRISILGDSLSTYEGISNDKEKQFTLVSNPSYYRFPFPLESTYWMRLIAKFNLRLCVNNAWSGAFLTTHFPGVGLDPLKKRSPGVERVDYLADSQGNSPDLLLIVMGLNDLGCGVEAETFANAYEYLLQRVKRLYPQAVTFCVGLPNRDKELYFQAVAYNQAIGRAVASAGDTFVYVNWFEEEQWEEYAAKSIDGLHLNEEGMELLAERIEKAFVCYYGDK